LGLVDGECVCLVGGGVLPSLRVGGGHFTCQREGPDTTEIRKTSSCPAAANSAAAPSEHSTELEKRLFDGRVLGRHSGWGARGHLDGGMVMANNSGWGGDGTRAEFNAPSRGRLRRPSGLPRRASPPLSPSPSRQPANLLEIVVCSRAFLPGSLGRRPRRAGALRRPTA